MPQPSLGLLDALAEEVRQAGLDVDLSVEGDRQPLPQTPEHSAYRVIQEALTNTVKHASATRAPVVLRYDPDALQVEVTDDGSGHPQPTGRPGHGLIGMRERTHLHGGRLSAGPAPGGGFAVSASFPLDGRQR